MNLSEFFVRDFREAAPYINYLRGKTLVIGIAGSLLEGATLRTLAADPDYLPALYNSKNWARLLQLEPAGHWADREPAGHWADRARSSK